MSVAAGLREVMERRRVRSLFQPVVDLDTGAPAGFEALARGPAGTRWESADGLFAQARQAGLVRELDWLCRETAVAQFRAAGLRYPLALFVNAEPEAVGEPADAARWASFGDLRCYAELTERELTARPAELLRATDQLRSQDWGIALDDIGAVPESLALMPLLAPDVLKLDVRLLERQPGPDAARTVHAVLTQAAATGAAVVAEGIETGEQLETARGYGVRYGQGFLFGRPGPLPTSSASPAAAAQPVPTLASAAAQPVPLVARIVDRSTRPAPFAVAAGAGGVRRLSRATVVELARQLLCEAAALQPAPVVLAVVPAGDRLPAELLDRLAEVAGRLPLVVLLGEGPVPAGVRGGRLEVGDPAALDLAVAVVGPYYAGVLAARPALPDGAGGYDAVLSFSRDVAVQAGVALLSRIPAGRP